ncbi:SCO6745 family protein [Paractinoplanes brasiliensis]|uniref:EvbL n=1 Tax=Paractinoplanes brasiliensis TaxID=52695 RepID=A0A4R6K022_9ACTN|nr:evbL [Actinoplanes brasiliensis]TDO42047.1 hypothetical protein C8E87_5810 [Actinoplanes brasiliensis]GID33077.1 hypothetical protein Abr02nite_80600 [Actinoplanes brasiliensis]
MTELTAIETARAADRLIHTMGSTWMISPETGARTAEYGYTEGLSFYFTGRAGVLGAVDAEVVYAAIGYFEPSLVHRMWEEGLKVREPRASAVLYGQACAAWGEDHLAGFPGVERLQELGQRVVDAADASALPLFAGWRALPPAADGPGRVMQIIHILRELRGGAHLVATTAAGLTPLQAILTNDGPGQAAFFGWTGEFEDVSELKPLIDAAEQATDRFKAAVYERALSPAERREFADLVAAAAATLPPMG